MTDTHTHLYLEEFDADQRGGEAVERALAAGVGKMVFPNVDLATADPMIALHNRYPSVTYMAMGLHPTSIDASWRDQLSRTRQLLDSRCDWVAIGEVGMDLYWDRTFRAEQMEAFTEQLRWARQADLPVIIHCREALTETLECIERAGAQQSKLLFHSFTGTLEDVAAIRAVVANPWFGINGVATFKKAESLRQAIGEIGAEHLVLETDSPYLAPVPHRGKRNESAYLVHTARAVAGTLGISAEELERITDANALEIFKLDH